MDPPPYDVNCPVCLEMFEDACQSTCCGQHVCGQCTTRLSKDPCPFCRQAKFGAAPDKFFMRQLLGLQVECRNSKRGCPWSGDLRALKQHIEETCRKNFAKCQHCSFECPHKAFPEHIPVCAEAPQVCPNRCPATGVRRKHLKHHLEQECVLRVVHGARGAVPHAANQYIQVAPLTVTMTNYSQYIETGNTWYSPPFYTHKNGYKVQLRVDANWYKKSYVSVLVCVLKGEYDNKLTWPLHAQVKVALYNWKTKKPFFSKVLHLPGDAFCSVNTTNLPASWGRGECEFISHAILASDVAKNTEYVQHDCLNFQIGKVTIIKAPEIPQLPLWAGNSSFVVPSFRSMKEKNLVFYGSPIHTHKAGYKLCPRVDPNGFGKGKGTHVSVSCTLMRGEHDGTLHWPIEADVFVEMLNWREDKNHKRYTVSLNQGANIKAISRVPVDGIAEDYFGSATFATHASLSYDVTTNTQFLNAGCLLFKVRSATSYLDKASARKLPAWMDKAMGSPYPCLTVAEFAKRKLFGNSYYSLPFYSHQNGYKMQFQVCAAKGGSVVLHLYLMKGPNDDWLQWPFRGDVVIELVNWRSDKGHHSRLLSLSSECTNSACERVRSGDRGMCWDHGNFISHDSLPFNAETGTEYLLDDCLHFRVKEVAVYSTQTLNRVPVWQTHSSAYFQFTVNKFARRKSLKSEYYSPVFYTHHGGYKMRLEVNLHKQGQYISVYARVLKGENDAILDWPIRANVVVELLNWRQDINHHSYSICFHERVSNDFNGRVLVGDSASSGWGTASFITRNSLTYNHSTNTEYLQDDCLCFRVKVVAYSTALTNKVPRWLAPNTPACFTITDVAERMQSGNKYYSPPFVAAKYKMCLSVYCGGFSAAKGKHLSMYACLLKGEDDDALEWPFCGDVTIEILNWRGDNGHYKKALQLDSPDDDSHARVVTEVMAPGGYGDSEFIPLSSLSNYLEDQCMCIRVSSVANYNTPLRSKTPSWQNWLKLSFSSTCPLEFTVTGFSSRLANGSVCYSPPFYTHSKGYKMRLEVTPGASGENRGHMSIFAHLMAGEYDASLKWPMNVDLSVEVVNWATDSFHILERINFGSADRGNRARIPEGSKSTSGWGHVKFCSHVKLFDGGRGRIQYVQDDCVRIRVKGAIIRSRKGLL